VQCRVHNAKAHPAQSTAVILSHTKLPEDRYWVQGWPGVTAWGSDVAVRNVRRLEVAVLLDMTSFSLRGRRWRQWDSL